jgi:hypothetical protein
MADVIEEDTGERPADCEEAITAVEGIIEEKDQEKQRADEAEAEVEKYEECCQEVVDEINEEDPNYDPQNPYVYPSDDPTTPTPAEKIEEIIEEVSGYTFPEDTPIEDIIPMVKGDPVSDSTTGVSLKFGIFVSNSIAGDQFFWGLLSFNPEDLGLPETQRDYYGSGDWRMGIILSDGTLITRSVAGGGGLWKGDQWKMTVDGVDPTASTVTCTAYYYGNPNVYTTYDEHLQGYGATGHRYKVKN